MKCSDLNAGVLSEVVSFQRETVTSDGMGGSSKTWEAISGAPTRAGVKAASGLERAQADRTNAIVKFKVTCRYFSGLREGDSVVIRSKRHNITFINNIDLADRWLLIDCDGGVAV